MESTHRRTTHDLSELLGREASDVDFFQLVRWIERRARELYAEERRTEQGGDGERAGSLRLESVGSGAEPEREVVRFHVRPTLRFPAGPVERARATLTTEGEGESLRELRWDVDVSFVGLVGPQGVLPQHYTELLLARAQEKDTAFRDLLDLLHQRLVSFFYRSWRKHELPMALEAADDARPEPLQHLLLSLAGASVPGVVEAGGLSAAASIEFAGHLGRSVASASAIEQALSGLVGVPAVIESFVGRWAPIRREDQGRLGLGSDGGRSPGLGQGFVLGSESWDVTSRARVHLGPIPFAEVARYHADRAALGRLASLFSQLAGPVTEPEVELHVERAGALGVQLGGPPRESGGLGWSAWLLDDAHPSVGRLSARLGVPEPAGAR